MDAVTAGFYAAVKLGFLVAGVALALWMIKKLVA